MGCARMVCDQGLAVELNTAFYRTNAHHGATVNHKMLVWIHTDIVAKRKQFLRIWYMHWHCLVFVHIFFVQQ